MCDFAWMVRRHEDDILNYFQITVWQTRSYLTPRMHLREKPFLKTAVLCGKALFNRNTYSLILNNY